MKGRIIMKRLVAMCLVIVLTMVLAGCQKSENAPSPTSTPPVENATIPAETEPILPEATDDPTAVQNLSLNSIQEIFGSDFFEAVGLQTLSEIASNNLTVSGDSIYRLMSNGDIYKYVPATGTYTYYSHVSPLPTVGYSSDMRYSDLDEYVQRQVDETVLQLIGTNDRLLGYCPTSGKLGWITESGIEWCPVKLDNSIQRAKDRAYPEDLLSPFVENNKLYAFYNLNGVEEKCRTVLLVFDLATGNCSTTELKDTYMMCRYGSGHILLLTGSAQSGLKFVDYDLNSGSMTPLSIRFPGNPGSDAYESWENFTGKLGGLAYHAGSDSIVIATADSLWISRNGQPLEKLSLGGNGWTELRAFTQSYFTSKGEYVFHNGYTYLIR